MNYRAVMYVLGKIFMVIGTVILLPISVSVYYSERLTLSFLIPSALLLFIGLMLRFRNPFYSGVPLPIG